MTRVRPPRSSDEVKLAAAKVPSPASASVKVARSLMSSLWPSSKVPVAVYVAVAGVVPSMTSV